MTPPKYQRSIPCQIESKELADSLVNILNYEGFVIDVKNDKIGYIKAHNDKSFYNAFVGDCFVNYEFYIENNKIRSYAINHCGQYHVYLMQQSDKKHATNRIRQRLESLCQSLEIIFEEIED